ncbi:hypothetical protein GOODEAATRI_030903, partial [Goodea atripinnis]
GLHSLPDHCCTVQVVTGYLLTAGLYFGVSSTRQWSDLPRGGSVVSLYASLTLAYKRSRFLSPWVLKLVSVLEIYGLLKSPLMMRRAFSRSAAVEWMTSKGPPTTADEGM